MSDELRDAAERLATRHDRDYWRQTGTCDHDPAIDGPAVARAYLNPWRPIESAPRDGTAILASDGHSVHEAWHQNDLWFFTSRNDCGTWNPTHWTTLPRPPAPAA